MGTPGCLSDGLAGGFVSLGAEHFDSLRLVVASFGFSQLIDIPTRMTQTTTALIDLLFVSNVDSIQSHGCLPNIADHEGIFVSFHNTQQKVPLQTMKKILSNT